MPNIETSDDLAEAVADMCGVYGGCKGGGGACPDKGCSCRIGFVMEMRTRIRQSVENDKLFEVQP